MAKTPALHLSRLVLSRPREARACRRIGGEHLGRPPISGLPEIGIIDAQVGQARLA